MGVPFAVPIHLVVDTYTTRRPQIENKVRESVEVQVKIDMREWGQSTSTKKLIEDLTKMAQDNDALRHGAQITLDNS